MTRRLAAVALLALAGCSRAPEPEAPKPAPPAPAAAPRPPAPALKNPIALFVGDSLTAGAGVEPEDAWPSLVEAEWRRRGLPWRARNAGVSGSTTAGALESVRWALTPEVRFVFVCIGANDGLRGTPIFETRRNLEALVSTLKSDGRVVVLAGMKIPPNYGRSYSRDFQDLFPRVARRHKVPFLPFLLEGVAARPSLNQSDGLHPNARGHRRIARAVLAFLDKEGLPR